MLSIIGLQDKLGRINNIFPSTENKVGGVVMVKKYRVKKRERTGNYRFGTGIGLIDMNILSGPDIERAVNGKPLPNEEEDDIIY